MKTLVKFTILILALTISTLYSGTRLSNPKQSSSQPSPTPSESDFSDRLTGDWGGLRTKMLDRGVDWTFAYTAETFGNLSGGALGRQGFVFGGLWEMGVDLDLEKLVNWKGASFHVNSFYAHGASLTQKYTGDLLTVSNIDDYDSLSLFELWFQQNFFDDKLSFRVGQLAADEEFATSDYSALFLNGTFGWPSVISANALESPAYGMAGLGFRLKIEPTDWFFTQVGIFDGRIDSTDQHGKSLNNSNTRWAFNKGDGIFAIGELGFKIGQSEKSKTLPGTYKLGAWLHTAQHEDLRFDDAGFSLADDGTITGNPVTGEPAHHRNNLGLYIVFDQMLYRVPGTQDNGLGFFFRAGIATEKISPISHYFDTGFNYKGLIKGRPDDIIGIGLAFANISKRIKDLEKDDLEINQPEDPRRSSHEAVLELTYKAQITPWFTLQPDFQYIINPGGSAQNDDAVVIGLRSIINF
jgi:porin